MSAPKTKQQAAAPDTGKDLVKALLEMVIFLDENLHYNARDYVSEHPELKNLLK